MISRLIVKTGSLVERIGRGIGRFGLGLRGGVFLYPEALALNRARLEHLESLGLDLTGKRVLEVGAGIGLLTKFFEDRDCKVLSTDAREENLKEMKRRFSHREVRILDLDVETDLTGLGKFEIVFCYGTLYHLLRPESALRSLAGVCTEMILLETVVAPWSGKEIALMVESPLFNQAKSSIGCRPTRLWVLETLKECFGYAYVSRYQPAHADFRTDWETPCEDFTCRAVFAGSRKPLRNERLLDTLPSRQAIFQR